MPRRLAGELGDPPLHVSGVLEEQGVAVPGVPQRRSCSRVDGRRGFSGGAGSSANGRARAHGRRIRW